MAKVLRIPRPSVHLGLDCRPIILYAYLPTEEKAREAHTSRSSTEGFGRGSGRGGGSRSGAGAPGVRCGSHAALGVKIWRSPQLLQGSPKRVNRALVVNCAVVNGFGVGVVRP